VAVETGQAIITYLNLRITSDATIKSLLGDPVLCWRVMATEDPTMPYFWHRLSLNGNLFRGIHTYYLDLYYYGDSPATADSAIDRVKILLQEHRYTTADDEAVGTINWFSGGYIPTDNAKVWHYATQWDVSIGAARDTTNIIVG